MGGHAHRSHQRPLRCASVGHLPWRTNLAVVLSIAAIAGCGQPSGPPDPAASDLPSGATGTAGDVAARPSDAAGGQRDPGAAATPDGDRPSRSAGDGEPGAEADGSRAGNGARGDGSLSDPASEAVAAPIPDAEGQEPQASAPPRAPDTADGAGATDANLDTLAHTVVALLGMARQDAGAAQLQIDATLVEGARDRACTMAQGETPLLPEEDTENVGLVVEPDPDAAARAMHDWWMETARTRDIRLTETFTRYGVGACTSGERVYYSERFGS